MSTRRARIKAVASLPVRRKVQEKESKTEIEVSTDNITSQDENLETPETQAAKFKAQIKENTTDVHDQKQPNVISAECHTTSQNEISQATENSEKSIGNDSVDTHSKDPVSVVKDIPQRRRIVKPPIHLPNSNRRSAAPSKTSVNLAASPKVTSHNSPVSAISSVENRVIDPDATPTATEPNTNILCRLLSNKAVAANDVSASELRDVKGTFDTNLSADSGVQSKEYANGGNLLNAKQEADWDVDISVLCKEYSIDPIIPLPLGNRNRIKLKPTPKLSVRRNSIQGSASESEEVVETIVVPSTPAPTAPVTLVPPAPPPSTGAPAKKTQRPRGPVRSKGKGPHHALTMYDLIFYNPPNNAIKSKDEEIKAEGRSLEELQMPADDEGEAEGTEDAPDSKEPEAIPVPQVKLGPNGEIVIDEQSLVIETSEAVRTRERLSKLSVVWDGGGRSSGWGSYGRGRRSREWGPRETLRFYRALHTLGTDFSLMLPLFPGRSRRDLKVKFKKEEKQNGILVDRALMNPLQFNMDELEREAAMEKDKMEEERNKVKSNTTLKADPDIKKKKIKRSSEGLKSISESVTIDKMSKPKLKRAMKLDDLKTDTLAKKASLANFTNKLCDTEGDSESGGSLIPMGFIPSNLETGSMIVLAETEEGGGERLQAYTVTVENGKNSFCAVSLPTHVLNLIAAKTGIIRQSPRPPSVSSLSVSSVTSL